MDLPCLVEDQEPYGDKYGLKPDVSVHVASGGPKRLAKKKPAVEKEDLSDEEQELITVDDDDLPDIRRPRKSLVFLKYIFM